MCFVTFFLYFFLANSINFQYLKSLSDIDSFESQFVEFIQATWVKSSLWMVFRHLIVYSNFVWYFVSVYFVASVKNSWKVNLLLIKDILQVMMVNFKCRKFWFYK